MSLANLSDLITSVANELHRSDLNSVIPDKITLAEVRINGDLDARLQDSKTTISCVTNQDYVDVPSDLISVRRLAVKTNPDVIMKYDTPDQFGTSYPYDVSGVPRVYTVVGSKFYLAPKPDSGYTLDIIYKAKVPSLVTNSTNWLMTSYPNVYLYAVLLEMSPYIKDDARMAMWKAAYDNAIDAVNSQDWYSGSTMYVRTDVR